MGCTLTGTGLPGGRGFHLQRGVLALTPAGSYLSCMPVLQEHTSFRRSRLLSVTAVIM